MSAQDKVRMIRAYAAFRALIDYCASSDCSSCIFSDFCDLIFGGGYTDLHDAACSALDYFPEGIAKRYSELKEEEEEE